MSKRFNIFLVDDDHIFSVIAKVTLNKLYEDIHFIWLSNGEEAIHEISSCADADLPTLLFLDINMPIMGGWDFLDALEKIEQRYFPICMTSSSIDPKDTQRANDDPRIIDFIEKPFNRIRVKALLDRILDNSTYQMSTDSLPC
jgi:response regulator RpfG family c-di-GMP phosphodiesterase